MNTQGFTPDNNSASKLNRSQIIGGFLFLAAGTNMGRIAMRLHLEAVAENIRKAPLAKLLGVA